MMYLATEQAVRDAPYEVDKLIEAYRIELGALRQQRDAALDVVVDLGGEVRLPEIEEAKQLRKDAERYRHIRKSGTWETEVGRALLSGSPEALDAAIDAAMTKETP